MIAVIFEAFPAEGEWDAYLDLAAGLRSELEKFEGFISVERFQSLAEPAKILSLSFWEDEESVARWRSFEMHRAAQTAGRNHIFYDYRLRIAVVVRDYGMYRRTEAPPDSKHIHQTKNSEYAGSGNSFGK